VNSAAKNQCTERHKQNAGLGRQDPLCDWKTGVTKIANTKSCRPNGYSELLQEDVKELGQNQLVRDLKKVENAGRHLLGLINNILDLSKIEAGRMDVFLENIEIITLLDEVLSIITPLAEKKR
jgi:signal transduction histidine kinase